MHQEIVRERRTRTCGFGFGGTEQQPPTQRSVICGRAESWERSEGDDDEGYGPNIVRGRE